MSRKIDGLTAALYSPLWSYRKHSSYWDQDLLRTSTFEKLKSSCGDNSKMQISNVHIKSKN